MATVKSSTMEENQRAVTKELDAVFQDIPLDAPPSLEDRWDHRAANTMSEISIFRSTDLPARPPSSFGQRNFEKSVSSASRSSTQINRYPFLSEAANDRV